MSEAFNKGDSKIERYYPREKKEISYQTRYDISVFNRFNEIISDTELQNHYKKWKDGINYNTGRKITIGGKIHNELKGRFMIGYSHLGFRSSVFFEDLINVNVDEYLKHTKEMNDYVDKVNFEIKDYNNMVLSVIEKIKKLEGWNDFIEFDGKKYGLLEKIRDNFHIENDCSGEMLFTEKETSYTFNDRPFCNYDDKEEIYLIFKCSKCEFENKVLESSRGGGSQYVSKTGFWWK
jgi:hypothetical protein